MRPIRVCELITELRPAGAERLIYELATRLDRRRFEMHVAALRGGAVADQLARAGVPVHVLDVRGKGDLVRLAALAPLLGRLRVDLLHTHLFHADLVGRLAARAAGVRNLVHTVHVAEARFRPWQFAWARLAGPWCRRIVCVSRAVARYHRRRSGLPADAYTTIYNGIDADAFRRSDAARSRLREQWGVSPATTLLAFVGRLDRQKGPETILQAMDVLAQRGSGVRLVMAGDGPMRADLERMLAASHARERTTLLGHFADVPGLLSAADMLVMPSRWEGFGLAAAEAMAAGLSVVATRVPGLEEVVADGQTGLLVRPDCATALADAIIRLERDPPLRERMGQAGRDRVDRMFRIQRCVEEHEKLYEDVMGG